MVAKKKSFDKRHTRKSGQAIIETIFMLPFIIAIIFFIYQAYLVVNKVQVVQKYLKGGIIGKVMNRNIITSDFKCGESAIPKDGRYFVIYNEHPKGTCEAPASDKYSKISFGATTITMLSYFCSESQKGTFQNFLKSQTTRQSLGVCMGGAEAMGLAVSPNKVLKMNEGATCSGK